MAGPGGTHEANEANGTDGALIRQERIATPRRQ